jgi:hypothetical protein
LRAISWAKSCLGSDIGAKYGEPPSIPRSRGDAECMLLGVLLLLVVDPVVTVGLYCAIPADMATLVCMHRRNGDECITTLCFLRFLFLLPSPF